MGCGALEDFDGKIPAHGIKVSLEIPEELLKGIDLLTIEEHIFVEKAVVTLIKDGVTIDEKTIEDFSENKEVVFGEIESGKAYKVKGEIVGKISFMSEEDEYRVIYEGEKTSPEIEEESLVEIDVPLYPLPANKLEVEITGDYEVEEVILKYPGFEDMELAKTYDEGVIFENGEEGLELVPGRWQLIIHLEGETSLGEEVLLLPTQEKEVNLKIEKKGGEIIARMIVPSSPQAPEGLRVEAEMLFWDEIDNAIVYAVYQTESDDPNSLGFPLAMVSENNYPEIEEDKYYWVRAYADGLSGKVSQPFYVEKEEEKMLAEDYFITTPGRGIKYQINDGYREIQREAWVVFQDVYPSSGRETATFVTCIPLDSAYGQNSMRTSALGGVWNSRDEKKLHEFNYGSPVSNTWNVFRTISIPEEFQCGDQWEISSRNQEFSLEYLGEYEMNGKDFYDCIKFNIKDNTPQEEGSPYTGPGEGYYVLAKGIGLIEIGFTNEDNEEFHFKYLKHQDFPKHELSGTIYKDGEPFEGAAVQLAIDVFGGRSVIDSDGSFSIEAYGEEVILKIGYISEEDEDRLDFEGDFPRETKVEGVYSDISDLEIEVNELPERWSD